MAMGRLIARIAGDKPTHTHTHTLELTAWEVFTLVDVTSTTTYKTAKLACSSSVRSQSEEVKTSKSLIRIPGILQLALCNVG